MALALSAGTLALAPGFTTFFYGSGGADPVVYSVLPGGAGGTINSSTGLYTAPAHPTAPGLDVIRVTDALNATAERTMEVGVPLKLLCEILRRQMVLTEDQVYIFDQKIDIPTDSRLYIAVGVLTPRPYAIKTVLNPAGEQVQTGLFNAVVDINILSRSMDALMRKEEILFALNSFYSQRQQEFNQFSIARFSHGFVNLSSVDGAAIPYRYAVSVNMQYAVMTVGETDFYSTFRNPPDVTTQP